MTAPAAGWLPGGRLHLQHGPIDLVIRAYGPAEEVAAAYRQAWAAFRPLLEGLVDVLPILRAPVSRIAGAGARGREREPPSVAGVDPGSCAARMIAAATAHSPIFVTPMAGVAGAVADHVLAAMTAGRRLDRAYVNNGGDAALWLSPRAALAVAGGPDLTAGIHVAHESPVRGVATSGWRGRSHSLGIADAITALARTAAEADVAATLIANAVDLPGHPAIRRRPARELAPDSDLGDRAVTVAVGALAPEEVARTLAAGRAAAERMRRAGLIAAAALWLAGECATVGEALPVPATPVPSRA